MTIAFVRSDLLLHLRRGRGSRKTRRLKKSSDEWIEIVVPSEEKWRQETSGTCHAATHIRFEAIEFLTLGPEPWFDVSLNDLNNGNAGTPRRLPSRLLRRKSKSTASSFRKLYKYCANVGMAAVAGAGTSGSGTASSISTGTQRQNVGERHTHGDYIPPTPPLSTSTTPRSSVAVAASSLINEDDDHPDPILTDHHHHHHQVYPEDLVKHFIESQQQQRKLITSHYIPSSIWRQSLLVTTESDSESPTNTTTTTATRTPAVSLCPSSTMTSKFSFVNGGNSNSSRTSLALTSPSLISLNGSVTASRKPFLLTRPLSRTA